MGLAWLISLRGAEPSGYGLHAEVTWAQSAPEAPLARQGTLLTRRKSVIMLGMQ
jgi:hypothetical protein